MSSLSEDRGQACGLCVCGGHRRRLRVRPVPRGSDAAPRHLLSLVTPSLPSEASLPRCPPLQRRGAAYGPHASPPRGGFPSQRSSHPEERLS